MELHLERLNAQHDTTAILGLDDPNASIVNIPIHHGIDLWFQIRTYMLNDIPILHPISQYYLYLHLHPNLAFTSVTVQLQKVKCDDNGWIVLIKSYHDKQSTGQRREVCAPLRRFQPFSNYAVVQMWHDFVKTCSVSGSWLVQVWEVDCIPGILQCCS